MLTLDSLQLRLSRLDSTDSLRQLFADWSYEAEFNESPSLSEFKADESACESVMGDAEFIAIFGEFIILYARLKDWKRAVGSERLVIARLLNHYPFALWIFSDEGRRQWHFVNIKRGVGTDGTGVSRRILRRFSFSAGEKPGR